METVNATQFRKDLFARIESSQYGEMVRITSKKGNSVLMSESDFDSLMETIAVLSDPETVDAIYSDEDPKDGLRWSDWKQNMS